jgi:hypothetical protein
MGGRAIVPHRTKAVLVGASLNVLEWVETKQCNSSQTTHDIGQPINQIV